MDSDHFRQIKDLFIVAHDLKPSERKTFLDEKCRGIMTMRQEVEDMPAAETKSDKLLESLIPEILPQDQGLDRLVGTQLGQYKIQRVISTGGMGTVYEALQENPRRTVAVKVMKQGIASKSALRRFEYESQNLARLRHPNIARVFESGTHLLSDRAGADVDAVPYFVKEYIPDALTITD